MLLRGHKIPPRSLNTIICDKNKLKELDQTHGGHVEYGRSQNIPLVLISLLGGEKSHLVESKYASYVNKA